MESIPHKDSRKRSSASTPNKEVISPKKSHGSASLFSASSDKKQQALDQRKIQQATSVPNSASSLVSVLSSLKDRAGYIERPVPHIASIGCIKSSDACQCILDSQQGRLNEYFILVSHSKNDAMNPLVVQHRQLSPSSLVKTASKTPCVIHKNFDKPIPGESHGFLFQALKEIKPAQGGAVHILLADTDVHNFIHHNEGKVFARSCTTMVFQNRHASKRFEFHLHVINTASSGSNSTAIEWLDILKQAIITPHKLKTAVPAGQQDTCTSSSFTPEQTNLPRSSDIAPLYASTKVPVFSGKHYFTIVTAAQGGKKCEVKVSISSKIGGQDSCTWSTLISHKPKNYVTFYDFRHDANTHYLSNTYNAVFTLENKKWNSVEHYFQYKKLSFASPAFSPDELMDIYTQMQKISSGGQAKALVREKTKDRTINFLQWNTIKYDIMYRAILQKFTEHKNLASQLLSTYPKLLVECADNDHIWGGGKNDTFGQGENITGNLVARVRNDIFSRKK